MPVNEQVAFSVPLEDRQTTVAGRTHYELLAGAVISVPVLDDNGNEIAYEAHVLRENVCIFIEGKDEVQTTRGVRVAKKK